MKDVSGPLMALRDELNDLLDTDFVALGHHNNAWNVVSVSIRIVIYESDSCTGTI